jgi:hypothetical protein
MVLGFDFVLGFRSFVGARFIVPPCKLRPDLHHEAPFDRTRPLIGIATTKKGTMNRAPTEGAMAGAATEGRGLLDRVIGWA